MLSLQPEKIKADIVMTPKEEKRIKNLETKIQQLTQQNKDLQTIIKNNKEQVKKQLHLIEKLSNQVKNVRQKNQKTKRQLKKNLTIVKGQLPQIRIERHKYTEFIVKLCVLLYTECNVSFRSVPKILQLLNNLLNLGLECIPSANTIENWIKKSGYKSYHSSKLKGKAYAGITDESMMLGGEKFLMTLGIEAEKEKEGALRKQDVHVLDISVASNWNSTGIKKVFSKVEEKMGSAPAYVISDNDTKLKKSIREKGYIHIRDVGHSMALIIEQVYGKNNKFKGFTKSLSAVKIREVMRKTSYLLPPAQRSIARFMNLSGIIKWGKKIINIFPQLDENEKQVFHFVESNHKMLNGLSIIFKTVNNMLKILKTKGMSEENISTCISMLQTKMNIKDKEVKQVKRSLTRYLEEEKLKLKDAKSCWHASSDIIESMFGTFKFRRSKNRLNGITPYVLLLPLLTEIGDIETCSKFDFKEALESVFMRDLDQWKENNLTENLSIKRRKKLAG